MIPQFVHSRAMPPAPRYREPGHADAAGMTVRKGPRTAPYHRLSPRSFAVASLLVPPLVIDYATAIGRVIPLAPYAMRRRSDVVRCWRQHRPEVIAIAVFSPLAYILVLYALTFTPVVYVAPTRELTVLAGSLLLGEGHLRRRLSWAVVILFGVASLANG